MTDLPPWKVITTDDYYPLARRNNPGPELWIEASKAIYALLVDQHEGRCRVRLVLRETHDMKPNGRRDLTVIWDFVYGPDMALSFAEIVSVSKEGRRHRFVKSVAPEGTKTGAG